MVAEPVPFEELEALFGSIAFFYEDLLERIAAAIETVFAELAEKIDELFTQLIESLVTLVDNIADMVSNIFEKLADFIEAAISKILDFVDEILTEIVTDIQQLIADASQFIKTTLTDIAGFIEALLTETVNIFTQIFDEIYLGIVTLVDDAATLMGEIFDVVVSNIERIVIDVTLQLKGLFGVVRQGVEEILVSVSELIVALNTNIQESIALITNLVDGSLRSLLDLISNLPAEIADLTRQIIASTRENIGEPLTSLPTTLFKTLIDLISGEPLDDADKSFISGFDLLFGTSPVERSPEKYRELVATRIPTHPVLKWISQAVLFVMSIVPVLMGMGQAQAQILLQEYALDNPYLLLDPADLIRSGHFDLLPANDVVTDLRKHGHTESDALILTKIGKTVAPEAEQVVWWLRGIISEDQFEQALKKHGWTIDETNRLKQSAFFIPPVQDLISMAVREVFTPEVAKRFGQFEDFPPQFVEQAAKVGLSQEWALNYWGAHWALPSVQMGFEMLHRRVITKDELDLLLRSADVMPFWRDKLVAISYSPLTRVDIRRMHKMGVLTEDQVKSAYRDIGYIEEDAQLLLDFTIALNEPTQAQDAEDLSSLTRSNIINFFKDGVFLRQEAFILLQDMGISADAADLYLDSAEMELQRAERNDEINIILDRADSGVISFTEAQDALNRLGLETNEIQLALAELAKREARRTKLPSREDLDKMLGADIIGEKEYVSTMQRIGYSTIWATRYLQLTKGT